MKMVKSLLLGSAAGLVAVSGGQAADLPTKAKPVEYVKVCSLYGAGFYYIPGSNVCLKIGGYIRSQYGWNVTGGRTPHYFITPGASGSFTGGGLQDRSVSPYSTLHRAHFNLDSRTQTPYGTLRTYAAIQLDNENGGTVTPNVTRAFIQWAGFTFGRTKSFTDVPGTPGEDTFKSLHATQNISDTGANGTNQIAYTWELGNGMTLNVGADERRVKPIANLGLGGGGVPFSATDSHQGMQHPTPWINFAVNQAWGRFGVSAVFNKNSATYYDTLSTSGHPDDTWGWAVLSGVDIKAPWLGQGDHFGAYFNYGVGAVAYSGGSLLNSPGLFGANNEVAVGLVTDAVYIKNGQLELTTAWTAGAGYEHYWLPNVSTAVYGTYTQVSYNDNVVNGGWFCPGCDPSFNYWTVGMVNNWYPVAGFRLAVDVLYTQIETAMNGETIALAKPVGSHPSGLYTANDDGILSVVFRAQRSFGGGD